MAITIRKIPSPSGSISNSDNSYTASVASGGSLELPDITITNSDNSYSVTTSSVQNINLPDENITINGTAFITKPSLKNQDISLVDQDDNTLTPTLSGSTVTVNTQRPADWLAMPSVTSADDTFVGLHAVFPTGSNFVAFTFTTDIGDYQVDWGDGNVDVVASNTQAQHQYDFTNIALDGTLTSKGYKQAIIIVTPVSGELRTAGFQKRYTTTPTIAYAYSSGFLDCILSMPNANSGLSITFGGTNLFHFNLELFDIKTIGNATSTAYMFRNCNSLQTIPLFDTSNVGDMEYMFNNCISLQSIPLLNTSNVGDMNNMFRNCPSLQSVPILDTSNVTLMNNMFLDCSSLQTVPPLDTTSVINQTSQFQNCYSLAKTDIICRKSVRFDRALLSQSELVNIFNNLIDLTGLTSQNINITDCWGASALTVGERQIATDKNWTITG